MEESNRPLWAYISNKIINREQLCLVDVLLLLVEIRRYIEHHRFSEKYPIAKFYCDWALHSETDRNWYAILAVKKINEYIRDPQINYVQDEKFIHAIFDAIHFFEAKKQIEEIIRKMIDSHFEENWSMMFSVLRCVVGIPIIWSKNDNVYSRKAREQLDGIDKTITKKNAEWNQQFPDTILINILTTIDNKERIVNLYITEEENNIISFNLTRSNKDAIRVEIRITGFQ